ncbi:tyrosine-type recombinase/integrase [Streptomyces sp. 5-10]|uniref:tyrosine-type recombinase/integrase n=1 Tax=Streptomyces sp. 5-10 TaxID=878925 RepID=UPI00168BF6C1|nr:tyrosine-type recombinase/integrase [Streptomyces sp. 5-10]MBD3004902.1 tyrosine-type recombinase/integrase [Streptomyces sp. 5-10]
MSELPAIPIGDDVVDVELLDDDESNLPATPFDINRQLTPEAAESMANSGRVNTRRTYTERWTAFANWCLKNDGRTPGPPTTEENLISYVDYLCRKWVDPGTVRLTVAAIRWMNARAGHKDTPSQEAALQRYADHRHQWNEAGYEQKSSPPLALVRLRAMVACCPEDTLAGLRNTVLLMLGYYMRARRSELAKLRINDIKFVTPKLIVARKRVSKNDKEGGKEYEIDDPRCVRAVRKWIDALVELGEGGWNMPLLRNVNKWDQVRPIGKKGGYGLTPVAINLIVKRLARQAKLDVADDVTAHGLRAGVPTDLGAKGYSAADIKAITGDWKSTEQVDKYRKIGRRMAGVRSDEGRHSEALSMLRFDNDEPGEERE